MQTAAHVVRNAGGREAPAVVRPDRLLVLYAVVPVAVLIAAVDLLVLGGTLRAVLPTHPDRLALFTVFFNLPHVVASHLIFLDAEYVRHYRRHLLSFGLALLAVTSVLYVYAPALLGLLAILATLIHIIGQQAGLTGAQLRTGSRSFTAWKWLTIVVGLAGYQTHPALFGLGLLLLPPWYLLAARLHRRAASRAGRSYLWANQALFTSMFVLGLAGYPLLALLMPRVVHDLTAFYVYGVHDHNRNRERPRNTLYRVAAIVRVPSWLAGPVAAIVIACVIERALPRPASLAAVYVLSAFHYYLEAIVWKRGTPHRNHTPFT